MNETETVYMVKGMAFISFLAIAGVVVGMMVVCTVTICHSPQAPSLLGHQSEKTEIRKI